MAVLMFCGFNGFGQFDSTTWICEKGLCVGSDSGVCKRKFENIISEFKSFNSTDYSITRDTFFISWSYISTCYENNLYICGSIDGQENNIKTLQLPVNNKINVVSGNRRQVMCVTEGGGCWQYSLEAKEWKDLVTMLCAESCEDDSGRPNIVKVCCGETITAILTDTGGVYNTLNRLTLPSGTAVDVACGRSHMLILTDRGEVFTVGEGSRGQLGHGELEEEEQPRLVEGLAGLRVAGVACGGWHCCAVTSDGDLYTWGWNMAGQLGLTQEGVRSKVSVQAVPVAVDWPDGVEVRVVKVACGARHTLALLDDGSLWGCGWNGYGQLALPGVENVHQMTRLGSDNLHAQEVFCGPWTSCLLTWKKDHNIGAPTDKK